MNNDKDFLLISILTFITIFVWIAVELTRTSNSTVISKSATEITKPIDPTFDTETLQLLETRTVYR